jgi:hypothetical protein
MNDLDPILKEWPYESGAANARMIRGLDGRMKLQLRIDLGVLQMEAAGRPDGGRPFGHESLLDHFVSIAQRRKNEKTLFQLNMEDCVHLQQEAAQYYHRFLAYLQLQDFEAAERDMQRNLHLFEFVMLHIHKPELANMFQQFYPYTVMMLVRVRSKLAVQNREYPLALKHTEWGIEQITNFARRHLPPDCLEDYLAHSRELESLRDWLKELRENRPLTPLEKLRRQMQEAVEHEDFERAARLRDALRELE